jgi:hypothetical protein
MPPWIACRCKNGAFGFVLQMGAAGPCNVFFPTRIVGSSFHDCPAFTTLDNAGESISLVILLYTLLDIFLIGSAPDFLFRQFKNLVADNRLVMVSAVILLFLAIIGVSCKTVIRIGLLKNRIARVFFIFISRLSAKDTNAS